MKVFLSLLIGLMSLAAQAAEFYEPFLTTRQMGMGGVYVFDEDDAFSFMQNPAYTCYTEGLNFTVFDIGVGIGDIDSYSSLTEATGSLPDPDSLDAMSAYYGKSIGLDAGGVVAVTLPCFGMSGFYAATTQFEMQNPAFPSLDLFYLTDYGVRIGGAYPISPVLSFGMDVKRVTRQGGPYTFGAGSLTDLAGDNALSTMAESVENEGIGYGFDAGLVSRFDMVPFNPTVSLSWKDIGGLSFTKTKGTDAPERQKDNLVLGMTIDGSVPLLGMAAGIEYRHITESGEQIGKKLHMGGEISIGMMDFRAGFNQGYTTYGFGLNFWILKFDAALYSVERGAYPGQTPEKRGHLGITLDLGFDPDFNLVDSKGRKRRLKQRR